MAALRSAPIALLLIAFTLAGCTGGGGSGSSSTPSAGVSVSGTVSGSMSATNTGAPATAVAKDIMDDSFPDGTFQIKVGTTVTWTHKGTHSHSVSSDTGAFDSNPNCVPGSPLLCMSSGQTYVHKFEATGTFAYHCRVHSSMTGTVTVVS
jgi:plastocyanin